MAGRRLDPVRVRLVMDLLASGLPRLEVARRSGVSKTKVFEMHRDAGGVYRKSVYSNRYLDRDERYEIARLKEAGLSLRAIGARMGRSPSTISRELARYRQARGQEAYQPERANTLAGLRQARPKLSLLARNERLRIKVQKLLKRDFSPEQVAGRLKVLYPEDDSMHISHEAIYRSIYIYPRGGLKRELQAQLRRGGTIRKTRGRAKSKQGQIPDAVSISERPPEVENRQIPGHFEGDLIMGSRASNSAVGTIVERKTGFLNLLHLGDGYQAEKVAQAVIDQMRTFPSWFTKTLTWDRGHEMAKHREITAKTGIRVYFADPYAPYQRGSNENTNGLLRQYLPKGTDLSKYSPADLQKIADKLNDRPRKRLGYYTPREAYEKYLKDRCNDR